MRNKIDFLKFNKINTSNYLLYRAAVFQNDLALIENLAIKIIEFGVIVAV